MITPFGDTHTFVSAPDLKRRVQNLRPGTDRVIKGDFQAFRSKGMPELLAVTNRAYLDRPPRMFCNDQLQYGHIDLTTGYLRILSFSDVLGRRLPNGWRFGLPNEVFRAPDGKTFDGDGIPPDIAVAVFADEDVAAGRDPAISKALEVLGVAGRPRR